MCSLRKFCVPIRLELLSANGAAIAKLYESTVPIITKHIFFTSYVATALSVSFGPETG